jgi:GrpB-like predicted nucleotidyltransferase (UPF0157 family)
LPSQGWQDRELPRESAALVQVREGRLIVVTDYDPAWPRTFAVLRDRAWPLVAPFAECIEHVGSTSVPGLAAKPVIDMDVVAHSREDVMQAIRALETLGYRHVGDLDIPGREALREPSDDPRHNLYVCARDAAPLLEHRQFREYLLSHPSAASEYAALKRLLAPQFEDVNDYAEAKTDFVRACLAAAR